jgi:3-hydroxyacyl-CoA dehydrogenase/enoyl-CoA hydratase/3-hydroxybutyryl-CoA epimerase
MDVKKSVLAELEEHVRDDCIICSNTSTFSITEMATALKKPERFVGMHFFNPVNRMPLVEIIPGAQTSKDSVNSAVALCQSLGKTPVVVGDCAGFLVNRILFPYLNEALHLIHEGLDFEYVDKVVKDFGMPMGPFVLNDEVGLDTACKAAKSIEAAYGERMKTLPHVGVLVEAGLLGRKSGKGFYIHEGKERKRNPEVDRLMGLETKGAQPSDGEIIDRLMLAKVNEAARCLEEGVVEKPEYLDMAMILGTGFPPFRGGPLRYADQRGLDQVVQRLRQLESTHGLRFAPAKLLVTMAEAGETFYK